MAPDLRGILKRSGNDPAQRKQMPPESARRSKLIRARSGLDYETGCDFYCLRFRVWYPSSDCAFRTRFQTYDGCRNCDQGRFNLKRHADTLVCSPPLPVVAPDQE